ncbi:MAG: alkaline phosphatase [Chloroflexaceae bacterium]|nr:alkaline phosphatase [Chloroflexaceae bacterium]
MMGDKYLSRTIALFLGWLGLLAALLTACGSQQPTGLAVASPIPSSPPASDLVAPPRPAAAPDAERLPESLAPSATPSQTPSPLPSPTPSPTSAVVRFAVIGDFGLAGPPEEEVATMVKSWNPDFIVTTGDNNYPSGAAETMDENVGQYYHNYIFPYQGTYGEGATVNRFYPVIGNHDVMTEQGQPYFDYFTLPGNERYYRVTHDPVAIFALNSMPGSEPDGVTSDSVQAEWLRQELAASDACWKLVVFHHPPYSSDRRGPYDWMRWPFQEWGADATLAGHHHVYERIMVDGMPHFVNGLGGGARYAFGEIPEGSEARYNADHGAMLVDATAGQITFRFFSRNGQVMDTYAMEKTCP